MQKVSSIKILLDDRSIYATIGLLVAIGSSYITQYEEVNKILPLKYLCILTLLACLSYLVVRFLFIKNLTKNGVLLDATVKVKRKSLVTMSVVNIYYSYEGKEYSVKKVIWNADIKDGMKVKIIVDKLSQKKFLIIPVVCKK